MDLNEAMAERRSVRQYSEQKINEETRNQLQQLIDECNQQSGLHIQLVLDDPAAFSGLMSRNFKNVNNYIALIGQKTADLEEKCGYYGEKIVLFAKQLGLDSCWVAATYSKGKAAVEIRPGEKLLMVISLGYAQEAVSKSRSSKSISDVAKTEGAMPDWFKNAVNAALLAPTAMNQQKFFFELNGDKVTATSKKGMYTKTDLGIVKYHFELGAGCAVWSWQ